MSKHRKLPSGTHLVMGRNPLREIIKHLPDEIVTIYLQNGVEFEEVLQSSIKVEQVSKADLDLLVGSTSHQGAVAVVRDGTKPSLESLIEAGDKNSVFVMLDGVNDPHNLGAIIRGAECFGADGVIWSYNRGPVVTPVVSKTSAGASEFIPLVLVSNLSESLRKLKKNGYFVVVAVMGDGAIPLPDFDPPNKLVIVLGGEGEGVSRLVQDLADYKVVIPMKGNISSLNVSQAAAVMLYGAQNAMNRQQR